MPFTINVARLTPQAQPIAEAAARVYLKHTEPWFIGLIVHGSAFKGGFIPGCSDIDFQLYLDSSAFNEANNPLELAINIHRDLARIDPTPFGYIQCYPLSAKLPQGWTSPIPGAYAVVAGTLPVKEATAEELHASAMRRLAALNPTPMHLHMNLLEHGAGRLQRHVRLLCTDVWPTLYSILSIEQNDPIRMWNMTKVEAMAQLPPDSALGSALDRFYRAVLAYYPGESSVERALEVIRQGVAFLREAKLWWEGGAGKAHF